MGGVRYVHSTLIRKPEGKGPLGRTRSRWEGNIRMNLTEKGSEGVERIHMIQDRVQWWILANAVMDAWVP
jgi:hypothetical protein